MPDTLTEWKNDAELFRLMKEVLYTPVVGDILDGLGCCHQFLPQPVQPALDTMKVAGRAMPVVMIDVHGPQKKPFGLLTEALDQLEPGEIYVASGGDMRCAYWGEILTATARTRGAVGAVIASRPVPVITRALPSRVTFAPSAVIDFADRPLSAPSPRPSTRTGVCESSENRSAR